MISIYAVPSLLCICLYMQAPAEAALTKFVEATRVDLGDKFRLIAKFEADSPVEVIWWLFVSGIAEQIKNGTTLDQGQATLEIEKGKIGSQALEMSLGDRRTHYLDMRWNTDGSGDRSSRLDLPLATISPSTNIVHFPDEAVEVTIAVKNGRGGQSMSFYNEVGFQSHTFWDKATNKVISGEQANMIKYSSHSVGGVTTTTVTFRDEAGEAINGFFRGGLRGRPDDRRTSALESMKERIVLNVHAQENTGPFPDGFISADFNERNDQVVCQGYFKYLDCELYCTSYGNDIQSVDIYKEDNSGGRQKQETKWYPGTPYRTKAILKLDPDSPSTPGKYVCCGVLEDGTTAENVVTVSV